MEEVSENKINDIDVGWESKSAKLIFGAKIGFWIGVVTDGALLLSIIQVVNPLMYLYVLADLIFRFNRLYVEDIGLVFSIIPLAIYIIEYVILGILSAFILDKGYHFKTKLSVIVIFIIINFIPQIIYQYNYKKDLDIINSINVNSDNYICGSIHNNLLVDQLKTKCLYKLLENKRNIEICKQLYDDPEYQNKCLSNYTY